MYLSEWRGKLHNPKAGQLKPVQGREKPRPKVNFPDRFLVIPGYVKELVACNHSHCMTTQIGSDCKSQTSCGPNCRLSFYDNVNASRWTVKPFLVFKISPLCQSQWPRCVQTKVQRFVFESQYYGVGHVNVKKKSNFSLQLMKSRWNPKLRRETVLARTVCFTNSCKCNTAFVHNSSITGTNVLG